MTTAEARPARPVSAGSGAAGHGYAAAPLPDAGADAAVGLDAGELYVAALGEGGGHFELRTTGGHGLCRYVVGERDEVGVAHRHECAAVAAAACLYPAVCEAAAGQGELALVGKHGGEHIDRDAAHGVALGQVQAQRLHAREREQADDCAVGDALLVEVLADAARGVAAHHGLRAVGVEDAHGEVGLGHARAAYEHQPVGAYAPVAVAPAAGGLRRVGDGVVERVNVYVVVARAVHLCELYDPCHNLLP